MNEMNTSMKRICYTVLFGALCSALLLSGCMKEYRSDATLRFDGSVDSLSVTIGDTVCYKVILSPADESCDVKWVSTDESVAEILVQKREGFADRYVKVPTKSVGKTIITATVNGNLSVSSILNVKAVPLEAKKVEFNEKEVTVFVGWSDTLKYTVTPEKAVVSSVEWKVKADTIAAVSSDGIVTGLMEGETKVYVNVKSTIIAAGDTTDYFVKDSCVVVVEAE